MRRALAIAAVAAVALSSGPADAARPKALESVAFDQRLEAVVPRGLRFRDETGREIRLGDALGGKPALVDFVYFRCPMLCPIALSGLAASLRTLAWSAGGEFQVVTVSIDPAETAEAVAAAKRKHLDHYGRSGAESGWRFLTGDETSIRALTDAVGFRYAKDEASGQYAHAAGVVVLTPDGRVSRYLYGVEPAPRDVRLALIEASEGGIGTLTDQILLLCFHWDPSTGKYGNAALGAVRVAGVVTLLGLGGFLFTMFRREGGRGSGSRHGASADPRLGSGRGAGSLESASAAPRERRD